MDLKKVLKTLFVIIVVPGGSALIAYYGVKYGKKKYDDWKASKNSTPTTNGDTVTAAANNDPTKTTTV